MDPRRNPFVPGAGSCRKPRSAASSPRRVARIIAVTQGYAYFLPEWGKQCWDAADVCPITAADVELAHPTAIAALDDSFFRVR